jgi:hypothetical protein
METSTLQGKFNPRVEWIAKSAPLRVNFNQENFHAGYLLLMADKVEGYSGSESRVYLKERVLRQKDYAQIVVFRPGAMIMKNGDYEHVFTLSKERVLLKEKDRQMRADKFVFDLNTYEVVSYSR